MFIGDGLVCVQCDPNCATCTGKSSTCMSCKPSKPFMVNNDCFEGCPLGFAKTSETSCSPCVGCEDCSESVTKCTKCGLKTSLYQNQCMASCAEGLIDQGNGICMNCDDYDGCFTPDYTNSIYDSFERFTFGSSSSSSASVLLVFHFLLLACVLVLC